MSSSKLYGLLGHPLKHSFSYKYFNERFTKDEVKARYVNFDLSELPDLKTFIAENNGLSGLNVTIPYKEKVITYLDDMDEHAENIGAVNVIQIKDGRLKGYNTDYIAFMQSISPLIKPEKSRALILGTGGASKAIKYALTSWHIPFTIVSRINNKGDLTYSDLNAEEFEKYNVIINTTPLGNFPEVDRAPEIPYKMLKSSQVLYDLTYNPEITEFLKQGNEKGCKTKNGYDMLIRQAELSWEIWNQ